jgi:ABC-type nitrate/sulfonate/bicarbonate transport system permease component
MGTGHAAVRVLELPMRAALLLRDEGLRKSVVTHVFTLALLVAWEITSWHFPVYLLPGPYEVGHCLWSLLTTPAGLFQAAASVFHVGMALLIAFVAGVAVALLPYYVSGLRSPSTAVLRRS